jgi:hypothetical protein
MSELRVIVGASFPRHGESALHDLAMAVRGGDPGAIAPVASILAAGLEREIPEAGDLDGVTLVPMASHLAGTASGPAVELAEVLRHRHASWGLAPSIERLADVPRAMDARERDAAAEAATLRWTDVPGEGLVLLIDDVVHSGATLEAAWLAAPPEVRARLVALVAFRAED